MYTIKLSKYVTIRFVSIFLKKKNMKMYYIYMLCVCIRSLQCMPSAYYSFSYLRFSHFSRDTLNKIIAIQPYFSFSSSMQFLFFAIKENGKTKLWHFAIDYFYFIIAIIFLSLLHFFLFCFGFCVSPSSSSVRLHLHRFHCR